jgi:two-component system response regulator DesR
MTQVVIATNEPILAKGLEIVLQAGGLQIAAVCGDVFELFASIHRCHPDIAVLDLPVLPAPEVIRDLRRAAPRCRFVLWPRVAAGRQMTEAIRCGALNVVSAGTTPAQFLEAINIVAEFGAPERGPAEMVNLSCNPRQRKLLELAGYGLSNQEIAALTGADETAVNQTLEEAADTLGAGDRYELALFGLSALKDCGDTP